MSKVQKRRVTIKDNKTLGGTIIKNCIVNSLVADATVHLNKKEQIEVAADMKAYVINNAPIVIERTGGGGYYVYPVGDLQFLFRCESILELRRWLHDQVTPGLIYLHGYPVHT